MRLIKRFKDNNDGSAMLVAIIVSVVVIAFSLSLLLVAYALFNSKSSEILNNQVKEVAKSAAVTIGKELTEVKYDSFADLEEAETAGDDNLYLYLRYNLFQDKWANYVDESTKGHNHECADRYFNMNFSGGDTDEYASMASNVSVKIYWMSASGEDASIKDESTLVVEVTATKGDYSSTVTSYYELAVLPDETTGTDQTIGSYNPDGNTILKSENWRWTKIEQN